MTILLQISDPHLMADPAGRLKDVPTLATLAAVLRLAREQYPQCARVIWTGDLSDDQSVEAYRLLREQLGDWAERSLFIPGNHDERRALREVFPEVGGDDAIGFVAEVGGWRLIGLDSQVPGAISGAVSVEQLDDVRAVLARDPHQPTLLFVHHPPVPIGSLWIDALRLTNPDPLESLVGQCPGVRGISCGHVHQVFDGTFAGVPVHTAPSTALQFRPRSVIAIFDPQPPGFRVIVLEGDQYRTEIVRLPTLEHPPGSY